jgi:hypothetical protein
MCPRKQVVEVSVPSLNSGSLREERPDAVVKAFIFKLVRLSALGITNQSQNVTMKRPLC